MVTELTRALSAFDDQVFLRSQQVSYGKAFFFSSLARFPVSFAKMVPLLFQLPWLIKPSYFFKHAVRLSILFIFSSDPLVEVPLLVLLFLHVSLPPNSPFPWQDMLPFG